MELNENIIYLEASANYTIFHLKGGKSEISSYTLKHYEKILEINQAYTRIHRRFLVNRNFVASHCPNEVLLGNGKRLPIARRRKYSNKEE
jgi:two-component system LytT family response regulator